MADTLTPAEREWVIAHILDRTYEDAWAREQIRAAPSEDDAITWCHRYLAGGGYRWPATAAFPAGSAACCVCSVGGCLTTDSRAPATVRAFRGKMKP